MNDGKKGISYRLWTKCTEHDGDCAGFVCTGFWINRRAHLSPGDHGIGDCDELQLGPALANEDEALSRRARKPILLLELKDSYNYYES
jgi:hypothetical protein